MSISTSSPLPHSTPPKLAGRGHELDVTDIVSQRIVGSVEFMAHSRGCGPTYSYLDEANPRYLHAVFTAGPKNLIS